MKILSEVAQSLKTMPDIDAFLTRYADIVNEESGNMDLAELVGDFLVAGMDTEGEISERIFQGGWKCFQFGIAVGVEMEKQNP